MVNNDVNCTIKTANKISTCLIRNPLYEDNEVMYRTITHKWVNERVNY